MRQVIEDEIAAEPVERDPEQRILLSGVSWSKYDLNGFGSATFRKRAKQRGIEPDECYIVGEDKPFPDIAFEVILSPPRIDHLAIYEGLRVREVWFWRRGEFLIHRLTARGYERRARSEFLPGLDFSRLAGYVERSDQTRAVREFRDSLR